MTYNPKLTPSPFDIFEEMSGKTRFHVSISLFFPAQDYFHPGGRPSLPFLEASAQKKQLVVSIMYKDPNEDIFQQFVAPQEIFHVCRSSSHLLPAFRADARPQAAPGGNISLV